MPGYLHPFRLLIILLFFSGIGSAVGQDARPFTWDVSSERLGEGEYKLIFHTPGHPDWDLYGPNEDIEGTPAAEWALDSAVTTQSPYGESGESILLPSPLFGGKQFRVYKGPASFSVTIRIEGTVPAQLLGVFHYTYGRGDEFYPLEAFPFSVRLEGGIESGIRMNLPELRLDQPVRDCGDEDSGGKSLAGIFLLGLLGGFIALLTPCVFPLIPLTVSYFTKQSAAPRQGKWNATVYGFFIFLIYVLLSLPFHLVGNVNPEILNNISTNVWLNLLFFAIFVFFAFSFFGYYEIGLPSGLANRISSKSGKGNLGGIFFMALTLAIVSFSCTGPILGSLLAGTASAGAWPLTAGLAGFGLALALPFALFAMFPGWLQSLPRSGSWLSSVKVVLGFLELAMAVKFLSNADLVQQWGILPREVFIGIWVLIGIATVLYLLGRIRFPHDSPIGRFSSTRIVFIALFSGATLYLIPGLTNTSAANLGLISGFPPPLCYSIYDRPVNCEKGIEPYHDYDEALAVAAQENKPLLIDFTGWACVNCRRMEENVWTNEEVARLMKEQFVVVSLYVDERLPLPAQDQILYTTKSGKARKLSTVGDRWATFQSENFNAVSQPQYAILHPSERALTRTKGYTPSAAEFAEWLRCGLEAHRTLNGD